MPGGLERFGIAELRAAEIVGKEIEVGAWRLREPQRPVRAVHESSRADRAEQFREMVLGRSPDPGDVPEHSLLFRGSQAPMDFLDHVAAGRGHDESYAASRSRERTDRRRA